MILPFTLPKYIDTILFKQTPQSTSTQQKPYSEEEANRLIADASKFAAKFLAEYGNGKFNQGRQ